MPKLTHDGEIDQGALTGQSLRLTHGWAMM